MTESSRQMHLGAFFFGVGHHLAAWRHPDVDPTAGSRIEALREWTHIAEAAKFDAIFFADNVGLPGPPDAAVAKNALWYPLDPLLSLAALSQSTTHIGLVATVSATYLPPYHLARKYASLDQISGGRSGWNLVTSGSDFEARSFGLDQQLGHAHRYARAHEYVKIVKGLWDTWEDDAFIQDKAANRFFDPTKLHRVAHDGEHFKVHGGLQTPRAPQGYPVLVQAGSSGDGQDLAAATAEVVFTAQADGRGGTCVLQRFEGPPRGLRPNARCVEDPSRHLALRRPHLAGGGGQIRAIAGFDRSGARRRVAVDLFGQCRSVVLFGGRSVPRRTAGH